MTGESLRRRFTNTNDEEWTSVPTQIFVYSNFSQSKSFVYFSISQSKPESRRPRNPIHIEEPPNLNPLSRNWNPERCLRMPYQILSFLVLQFPMALTQILFLCVAVCAAAGCIDFPAIQGASAPDPPLMLSFHAFENSYDMNRNDGACSAHYIHSNMRMPLTFSRLIDPH